MRQHDAVTLVSRLANLARHWIFDRRTSRKRSDITLHELRHRAQRIAHGGNDDASLAGGSCDDTITMAPWDGEELAGSALRKSTFRYLLLIVWQVLERLSLRAIVGVDCGLLGKV